MTAFEIERELRTHFSKRNRLSAEVDTDNGTFYVDPMDDGGYAVQPKGDLRRIVKVWNLTKAAKVIADWNKGGSLV